jgi:uncharacterized protein YnzC (UPF0291/DUF896 family)
VKKNATSTTELRHMCITTAKSQISTRFKNDVTKKECVQKSNIRTMYVQRSANEQNYVGRTNSSADRRQVRGVPSEEKQDRELCRRVPATERLALPSSLLNRMTKAFPCSSVSPSSDCNAATSVRGRQPDSAYICT